MDCFLVLRGTKTLHLRMQRHSENALQIANYLSDHSRVEWVRYPHHEDHPHYELAKKQMKVGGGMVSFLVKDGQKAAFNMVQNTEIFALAESLGGVESLIEVPAGMTHMSTLDSSFAVSPALVRLSVGVEHVDDLIADLDQALARA
jgi:cystathionine beta-lyase/cystathionine gamma-synthase